MIKKNWKKICRAFGLAVCALWAGVGVSLGATSVVENFDSFAGSSSGTGYTTLNTQLGTMTATSGHMQVHTIRYKSSPNCFRLVGQGTGTNATATLDLTGGATTVPKTLSFVGERWSSNAPFSFKINAANAVGTETIVVDASAFTTGSNPLSQNMSGVVPVGTVRLIFRCEAPSSAGVLLDDLTLAEFDDVVTTTVGAWPAMVRMAQNGLIRIAVQSKLGTYTNMQVDVDLSSCTDNLSDIDVVELYSSSDTNFLPTTATLLDSKPATAGTITLNAASSAFSGTGGTLWISVRLKGGASLDRKVGVKLKAIRNNGVAMDLPANLVTESIQRIGYAVSKTADNVFGGPTNPKPSTYFRIPAMLQAQNGDLIATFDIRYNTSGDLPAAIDVGCSRSSDGGITWTPIDVIMHYKSNADNPSYATSKGVGDPTILLDDETGKIFVVALAGTGLVSSVATPDVTSDSTAQYVITSSTDHGQTWSPIKSLNTQIKYNVWRSMFQGVGHGLMTKKTYNDGTGAQKRALVLPSQIWTEQGSAPGLPRACLLYSFDHGETWVSPDYGKTGVQGVGVKVPTSENTMVELADGRLMTNARNEGAREGVTNKVRRVFTSSDLGSTWQAHATDANTLVEPGNGCMGSLLAVENSGSVGRMLVFSNPSTTVARQDMTLQVSYDEGMTWPSGKAVLYDSRLGAGYSDICTVSDGHIGILYEGAANPGASAIFYLRIPYEELLPTVQVDKSDIVAPTNGTSGTRLVQCDGAWTVSSSADWLVVGAAVVSGNGNIIYTVASNTSGVPREATITLQVAGLQPITIDVSQAGDGPLLVVTPATMTAPATGTVNTSVVVTSNVAWTVTNQPAWATIAPALGVAGNTPLTVTVTANAAVTDRSGNVVFTTNVGGVSATLALTQRGTAVPWTTWVEDEILTRDPSCTKTGLKDDPAGDGVSNLMKYATGLDPLEPIGSVAELTVEKQSDGLDHLVLSWPVNPAAINVQFEVEATADLDKFATLETIKPTGQSQIRFVDPQPVSREPGDRRFLRLRVKQL